MSAESSGVPAVEKVIQLLDGMLQKGQEAVHAEERHYSDFQQWCETTQTVLKVQSSEFSDAISVEHAQLDDFSQASDDLKPRISEHQLAIGHHEGDKSAATKVRAIDKDDYDALHKDYTESIEAFQMAIKILSKQNYDRKQAALIQSKFQKVL